MQPIEMKNESICRKCFHSYVCEQFNEHRDEKNDKCHFHNDHFVPAADYEPVRHGRWQKHKIMHGFVYCNSCNDVYLDAEWLADGKWSYCPNCGAKMDLEGG